MTMEPSLFHASATDTELVDRSRAGDLKAYGELMTRYRVRFSRYAYRMLGSRDAAEDALQEAFVRAYGALDQCRDPDESGAWLFRIVVDQCRTIAARRARPDAGRVGTAAADAAPAVPGLAHVAAWREEIAHAPAQLGIEQREAFLLKHVEDLSYEEMAALTGAGTSVLEMRVTRACERLRELSEGVCRG